MDKKPYPPHIALSEQMFVRKLASYDKQVEAYEDDVLQTLARSVIPEDHLKALAQAAGGERSPGLFRDFLLLELLSWFKNEFFRWYRPPTCCNIAVVTSGSATPTVDDLFHGASNIEIYSCSVCFKSFRFPRYNNPGKLLETREGRCGEWANCFTLCAKSVGFDARFVVDWTDHVWTEVYSEAQSRWLHCDPCENVCDRPLLYEAGWGKTLSYVFAFSAQEIVDVAWRYSQNHKEVMKRRLECREITLLHWLNAKNQQKQAKFSPERRHLLARRLVCELVELLTPREEIKLSEQSGRSSGELAWRKMRGELGPSEDLPSSATAACSLRDATAKGSAKSFTFHPTVSELNRKEICVRFCPAENRYFRGQPSEKETVDDWSSCVYTSTGGIFRKVEMDWSTVYLARAEKCEEGSICWKFDMGDARIKKVFVRFEYATFESGKVTVVLCGDEETGVCVPLRCVGSAIEEFSEFNGCKQLLLEAMVSGGGSGNCAWQKAQLFRSCFVSTSNENNATKTLSFRRKDSQNVDDCPFYIRIVFQ